MKYFDTLLLVIIILMGCWIIYRDYTNDDIKQSNEEIKDAIQEQTAQLPQIIRDAINDELFIYEEETYK